VPQGYNDYGRLALDFNWELDFWGKNARGRRGSSEVRAAQADAAEARLMLHQSCRRLCRPGAALRRARRGGTRRHPAAGDQHPGRQPVANGLDTRGEQRQAEAEPLQSRAELTALDEQIALTRNRLAALLGAAPTAAWPSSGPPPPP